MMLKKLNLPENCIKNIEIPLNKIFDNNSINNLSIQECKLYASINSELLNIQKSEKNDSRYDEIHFIYIKISNLFVHSDLYRIVKQIYRKIKYQVVIIIELEGKIKIGLSYIVPGKKVQDDNIIKHFLFSQWIYNDFETKEINTFFNSFSQLIQTSTNVNNLYNSIFKQLSMIDYELYTFSFIETIIYELFPNRNDKELLIDDIKNKVFSCKIYKHSNGNKFRTDDEDVLDVYSSECIWYALNQNQEIKDILQKRKIINFEELQTTIELKNDANRNQEIQDNIFYNSFYTNEIMDPDGETFDDCDWEELQEFFKDINNLDKEEDDYIHNFKEYIDEDEINEEEEFDIAETEHDDLDED